MIRTTKILFVALDYHSYTRAILDEMRQAGAEVDFVDIQPRSLSMKVICTLAPGLYARYLRRHHQRAVVAAAGRGYDKVIFLQAHQFALEDLKQLRVALPQARFVLYNWDALSNHDYLSHSQLFDTVYTFDRLDAEEHGFEYLPLFCVRGMQDARRDRARARAVYTVGNIVNPKRYHAVKAFAAYCQDEGIEFRAFLKISPVVWVRMLRQGCWPRGVSFRSIDRTIFTEMIETSAGVFDFANHQQSGQTMRTIENLCTGKKIITNNAWVRQEPFHSEDRFQVYENYDFAGVSAFLDKPLETSDKVFPEYYIQSFVATLLGAEPPMSSSKAEPR